MCAQPQHRLTAPHSKLYLEKLTQSESHRQNETSNVKGTFLNFNTLHWLPIICYFSYEDPYIPVKC